MSHLIYLFAAVVLIAAGLSGIAFWSPRPVMVKVSALVLAGLLMLTGHLGLLDLLGRPKPASLEWAAREVPEATVLASVLREDEAIYLWLRIDGASEPRAYVLPWSMAEARQLQKAQRRGRGQGTAVRMRGPFKADRETDQPMFYAAPQPALPPKTVTPIIHP